MATIRAYTTIEQSRKLAEILPLESADMYYEEICNLPRAIVGNYILHNQCMEDKDYKKLSNKVLSPAWSLAALLEQLPYELCDDDGNSLYLKIDKEDDVYQLVYEDHCLYGDFENIETDRYEHFVDACYELILKLNELNLL